MRIWFSLFEYSCEILLFYSDGERERNKLTEERGEVTKDLLPANKLEIVALFELILIRVCHGHLNLLNRIALFLMNGRTKISAGHIFANEILHRIVLHIQVQNQIIYILLHASSLLFDLIAEMIILKASLNVPSRPL